MIVSSSLLSFGSAIANPYSCQLLYDKCGWIARAFCRSPVHDRPELVKLLLE